MGQHFAPKLLGIPSGLGVAYSWTVSDASDTFQSWTADTPPIGGNPANPDATYEQDGSGPMNIANPGWYWNVKSSAGGGNSVTATVTCTATVTPPAGQGAAFTVTLSQPVTVWTPTWNCTGIGGEQEVNNNHGGSNASQYWLYAGPTPQEIQSGIGRGMTWNATVSAPAAPVTFGTGSLEIVQIIQGCTENYTYYVLGFPVTHTDPLNGQVGLDTSWPYGWVQSAPYLSGDSPGLDLTYFNASNANMNFTFEDYLMYAAPSSVQYVPLGYFVWTTSGSATIPSTNNWANFANPAGTVSDSGSYTNFLPGNTFPTWTQVDTATNY